MRRSTQNQPRPAPPAPPVAAGSSGWPLWLVGTIVVLVLVFGMMWLRYRRNHPAESTIEPQMAEINRRMAREEMLRATEELNSSIEARQLFPARSLPEQLTKEAVIAAVEECPSFQPRHVISLGKVQGTDRIVHVTFKWTAADVDRPQTGEVQFHLKEGTWERGEVWFVANGRIRKSSCR